MKTVNFSLSLLLCFIIAGCGDGPLPGMIWDIAPFEISISVVDDFGNDLLDPEAPNTLANCDITAVYDGQAYKLDEMVQTKAYMACFKGLVRLLQTVCIVSDWESSTETIFSRTAP